MEIRAAGKKIRAAFDGLRSFQSHSQRNEVEVKETLTADNFAVTEMVRHGFPYRPTCIAFDPVQRLLAIGTQKGTIRILGRPGVDVYLRHPGESKVETIYFLVNEGALISLCADDCLHLWNFRQKKPDVVQTLQFQREKLTSIHLPFQSKWLYLGTERGNVHVASVESFTLSGYVINWNKAIDLSQKTHPGAVVHLSDCPTDESKLLIGFDRGTVVLWDWKQKQAEARFQCEHTLRSISWHYEGKQFICGHSNGSLTTWSIKKPTESLQVVFPHSCGRSSSNGGGGAATPAGSTSSSTSSGKPERFRPIQRVEWKHHKNGDEYIIFSGGTPFDDAVSQPCVTVLRGKSIAVLEMEHPIVSLLTFCDSPYGHSTQDPYAVAVLLSSDLVVVDLTTPGYPCFENPYPMDIHESPVTSVAYVTDCPTDLISAYYSVGSKQKRQGYTDKSWPIKGGEWGSSPSSFPEIVVTGHADGSLKFWDSSSVNLQVLYKLKTSKALDKPDLAVPSDMDPMAVKYIALCPDSRQLAVGFQAGHVMFFKFGRQETTAEVTALEVSLLTKHTEAEPSESESKSLKHQQSAKSSSSRQSGHELRRQQSVGSLDSQSSCDTECGKDVFLPIKVKGGPQKRPSGYQVEFVSLTPWSSPGSPETVTALALNSAYGMLAYGTERGVVVLDTIQQICIFNAGTVDMYGIQRVTQLRPLTPAAEKQTADSEALGSPIEKLEYNPGGFELVQSPLGVSSGRTTSNLSAASGARMVSTASLGPNQVLGAGRTLGVSSMGKTDALSERGKSQDKELNRSRSSSTSSMELPSSETVCALNFIDSYNKKTDWFGPSLWIGTSQGSALVLNFKIPGHSGNETRMEQQVVAAPTGVHFRLRGQVLCMGFLDQNGSLLLPPAESWKDSGKEADRVVRNRVVTKTKICSTSIGINGSSSGLGGSSSLTSTDRTSSDANETQSSLSQSQHIPIVVLCSERSLKLYSLASCNRLYSLKFDTQLLRAEVIAVLGAPVLIGYGVNGRMFVYSLPSLRLLADTAALPANDTRIARTLQVSHHGYAVCMCSPTEMLKLSVVAGGQMEGDVSGELFVPCNMPEPPKQNFLKELFGGAAGRSIDREELFGEASGKASRSIAKLIPGGGSVDSVRAQSSGATSEIMKARLALNERGEKLSDLEDKSAMLMDNSKSYSDNAHELMNKYKNKKWYQF